VKELLEMIRLHLLQTHDVAVVRNDVTQDGVLACSGVCSVSGLWGKG
jgi:hypothetical protein